MAPHRLHFDSARFLIAPAKPALERRHDELKLTALAADPERGRSLG